MGHFPGGEIPALLTLGSAHSPSMDKAAAEWNTGPALT